MIRFVTAACAALSFAGSLLDAQAAPRSFPPYVSIPAAVQVKSEIEAENFGQAEITMRERTEILRGKVWSAWLNTSALGNDERKVLAQMIASMTRGGWQVVVSGAPAGTRGHP